MNGKDLHEELVVPLVQLKMKPPSRGASASFLFRKQRKGEQCTERTLDLDDRLIDEMIRLRTTVARALMNPEDPQIQELRTWLLTREQELGPILSSST